MVSGRSGVSAVAAAPLGGPAVAAGVRMAVSAIPCVPGRQRSYPFVLSPLQLAVEGSRAAGAIFGNLVLLVLCGILGLAATLAVESVGALLLPKYLKGVDGWGFVGFPAGPLLAFEVLYAGTVLGSMDALFRPRSAADAAFGVVGCGVCLLVPWLVTRTILHGVVRDGLAFTKRDTEAWQGAWRLVLGDHEWVSTSPHPHWSLRWSAVVRPFRQESVWYVPVHYSGTFAVSAINATAPETMVGCGHQKLSTGLVFMILFALEVLKWPHLHTRNVILDAFMMCTTAAAMFATAVGYYSGDPDNYSGFDAAAVLLKICLYTLYTRVALDVVYMIYVVCSGRRSRLQREVFGEMATARGAASVRAVKEDSMTTEKLGDSRTEHSLMATRVETALVDTSTLMGTDDAALDEEAPSQGAPSVGSPLQTGILKRGRGNRDDSMHILPPVRPLGKSTSTVSLVVPTNSSAFDRSSEDETSCMLVAVGTPVMPPADQATFPDRRGGASPDKSLRSMEKLEKVAPDSPLDGESLATRPPKAAAGRGVLPRAGGQDSAPRVPPGRRRSTRLGLLPVGMEEADLSPLSSPGLVSTASVGQMSPGITGSPAVRRASVAMTSIRPARRTTVRGLHSSPRRGSIVHDPMSPQSLVNEKPTGELRRKSLSQRVNV